MYEELSPYKRSCKDWTQLCVSTRIDTSISVGAHHADLMLGIPQYSYAFTLAKLRVTALVHTMLICRLARLFFFWYNGQFSGKLYGASGFVSVITNSEGSHVTSFEDNYVRSCTASVSPYEALRSTDVFCSANNLKQFCRIFSAWVWSLHALIGRLVTCAKH